MGHTQGLPNSYIYRVSVPNVDKERNYFVSAALYDNEEGKNLLYKGQCQHDIDCGVLSKDNPDQANITLVGARDKGEIKQLGVSDQYQVKCQLTPDDQVCEQRGGSRVYYVPGQGCRTFDWGGCGEVEPFQNVMQCQQVCF